jgi:hypothetical protein
MNKEEYDKKLKEIEKVHTLKKKIHNLNINRIIQIIIKIRDKYKMNKEDKDLLELYMQGFNDELKVCSGKPRICDLGEIERNAYRLGRIHALVGDDVSSVDEMSDEDILKEIKNG